MQVWVEVQHCEERVQLLCTITRAVETHVSILQDELCKVRCQKQAASPSRHHIHSKANVAKLPRVVS